MGCAEQRVGRHLWPVIVLGALEATGSSHFVGAGCWPVMGKVGRSCSLVKVKLAAAAFGEPPLAILWRPVTM